MRDSQVVQSVAVVRVGLSLKLENWESREFLRHCLYMQLGEPLKMYPKTGGGIS